MMRQVLVALQILFSLVATQYSTLARAATLELHAQEGRTKFTAIGRPAMLRIAGESPGPEGVFTVENRKISGEVHLDLTQLQTGIGLRDEHMKNKYLEVGAHPKAILILDSLELPEALQSLKKKYESIKFTGLLKLHGVEKPIEGHFELEPDPKGLKIVAQYSVNLSDYKIDIPNYAGLKVADKVDIETSFKLPYSGAASSAVSH